MSRWFTAAVLATIVAALSPSLSAQWPSHPVGVPKGPDGRPDLTAPAPRTADGKPDLSGVWNASQGGPQRTGAQAGRPPLAAFGNAGAGLPGGLPFQPWAAELQRKRAAENSLNNPDGLCKPQGPMQYHLDPQPRKVVLRNVLRTPAHERADRGRRRVEDGHAVALADVPEAVARRPVGRAFVQ